MVQETTDFFTNASQAMLSQAASYAITHHNPTLMPIHIARACMDNDFCRSFLQALHIPLHSLMPIIDQEISRLPQANGTSIAMDQTTYNFIQDCKKEADALKDTYISLEHIILTLLTKHYLPQEAQAILDKININKNAVLTYILSLRKGKTVDNKNAENSYQILEKYCINVTEQARLGTLDPVIGRHEEIRRVIQILSRRTKNNPVLIGEPGVGKTAIVEGLAQRIINNDVPESLKNKVIYSLDLGLLIAGTKYQGEFEDRLKNLLKEIEASQDAIVLFIDELHMLVGAGSAGGGMDASNLLKPALARGTLHCIGATTLHEYKKYIEKDAALERRFQRIIVEEPSIDDAISILRGLKERFELHHGIRIKDQALVDAVTLSAQYIPERFLPDKAIDLVDEATAMVKMSIDSQPEALDKLERKMRQLEIEKVALAKEKDDPIAKNRLMELEKELAHIKEEHSTLRAQWKAEKEPLERINKIKEEVERANYLFQQAEREGNYAKASEIKYGTIVKLEQKLTQEQELLKNLNATLIKQQVDEHDIAKVLSRWSGIPVEKLELSESEKLLHMDVALKKRVIGQDEAITQIVHAIQLHRTGLTDPNRPIGSFLFLGPTGVGKTEVAKTLANFLFNDPNKYIRIDMSEYMEKHSVARLIGAPPGYVGYEEGGQLTEQVRRHPYSVILFDEIEKAHPDVFNIFLQILDEGHLTDSQGKTVSFKNSIIIMTSNIGSDIILEAKSITAAVKTTIEEQLKKIFRPEFLNRIDAIIFFKMLSQADVEKIAHIQIDEIKKRLLANHITLHVPDDAIRFLAELGYVKEYGARPLKRTIQQHLSIPLSHYLLQHPDAKKLTVVTKEDHLIIM